MSIFLYIIYSLVKESCRHFDIVPTFDDVDFFDSVDKKENVLIDDRSQWKENKFRIVRSSATSRKQQNHDICSRKFN